MPKKKCTAKSHVVLKTEGPEHSKTLPCINLAESMHFPCVCSFGYSFIRPNWVNFYKDSCYYKCCESKILDQMYRHRMWHDSCSKELADPVTPNPWLVFSLHSIPKITLHRPILAPWAPHAVHIPLSKT